MVINNTISRKNIVFNLIPILTLVLFSCIGTPKSTGDPLSELDNAIREISIYINQRVPNGNNIAIVNLESDYPAISDYIITTLMENLVNDGHFTVVTRQQLDAIREELKFQMSGEVDDNTAQSIGHMVGAQTIILGSFTKVANTLRLTVRALSVETAAVQGIFSQTIKGTEVIKAFTGKSENVGIGTTAGLFSNGEYQGAMDLTDAVKWINTNAVNRGNYVIVLGRDEVVSPLLLSTGNRRVNVTLRSNGREHNITFDTPTRPSASLFTIGNGITFTLEDEVILVGLRVDSRPLVRVSGGVFIMNGGTIKDNFLPMRTMTINSSWDVKDDVGGGVCIENGSFVMHNGTINGNFATSGGGVFVGENAVFILNEGTISDNTACYGGGIANSGNFTMRGGLISNNSAKDGYLSSGGGVTIYAGIFTMESGVIRGNYSNTGGGVSIQSYGRFNVSFIKSGGTIFGSDAFEGQSNRTRSGVGDAVLFRTSNDWFWLRNSTAGENRLMDNRTYNSPNNDAWEYKYESEI